MKHRTVYLASIAAAVLLLALLASLHFLPAMPAMAQLTAEPQPCVCSAGTNAGHSVTITHCQCGVLNCAVIPASAALQCAR